MVPIDLSLLELAPVRPSETPLSVAYEKWVGAGKPCLRQSYAHRNADHIPSEAVECDPCDCLRFVRLTHPDDCRCAHRYCHHRLQRCERAGSDWVNAAIVGLVIADALAQVSAEHTAVARRSYDLGWSTAQIADDLHTAEGTATSRLHSGARTRRLSRQTPPTFS
jgi:hypothetical protein